MKVKFKKLVEVDLKTMRVDAGVRYWDDATMNGAEQVSDDEDDGSVNKDFPCRQGDDWRPEIELETGKILNWQSGVTADIHFKVCDAGIYQLCDAKGDVEIQHEGYVPAMMCPRGGGFGDYIIMQVDGDGVIDGFRFSLDGFDVEED